ncbi:hypothetical protein [Bradyrhizobium sp. ORS 375]|uniref:hypothetical protein n=1 Tax=Bradyrhizobium sp. (strain ORS 375) TaxID=566679 RepID=UPI001FCBD144|nr:hypothetical protein [Bradyrhizobium sp. ORS 375]
MARLLRKMQAAGTTGQPDDPAFPARWVDGLYAVSLVSGLVATIARAMREGIGRELDASIGAPGRCDFTVLPDSFVRAQLTRCKPTGHRSPPRVS